MDELIDPAGITSSRASRVVAMVMHRTLRPLGAAFPAAVVGGRGGRAVVDSVIRVAAPSRGVVRIPVRQRLDGGLVLGEWVTRHPVAGERIVYFLHGSAFYASSPAAHRGVVAQLCRAAARPAFTLRYRLAPRYRFPAAHEDALRGYRWLLAAGFRAEDIVVAGDSAGGHLALALVGELYRLRLPQPAGVVVVSPVVDLTAALAAERERQVTDPFMTAGVMRDVLGRYAAGADPADSRLDPRRSVAAGIPPVLIQVGGRELLAADAEAYAAALRAAGGSCELQVWPGLFHGFHVGYRFLPEARAALAHVARFVATLDSVNVARLSECEGEVPGVLIQDERSAS